MENLCEKQPSDSRNVPIIELRPDNRSYSHFNKLKEFYYDQYQQEPKFYVRVPGRVNIIGEHVDYCGFPVIPMATEQSIYLAVGSTKENTLLRLRNVNKKKFENYDCDLKLFDSISLEPGAPQWYKYFLCGVKGVFDEIKKENKHQIDHMGVTVVLSGNIPPAAGLSSSSALVCSAVLAMAYLHNVSLNCNSLASISAICERYIGTEGGGMDQAIAFLATEGFAQMIHFEPKLSTSPIELPPGIKFVVANSLIQKNKAASSDFNERVVECKLASMILAQATGVENWYDIKRLAQLMIIKSLTFHELKQLVQVVLPKESYTRFDICNLLNVSEDRFEETFLSNNTAHMHTFKLKQRAWHVVEESMRVIAFRDVCKFYSQLTDNDKLNDFHKTYIQQLSDLMYKSHCSLQNYYECSHENLDQLVSIADSHRIKARMTGAGWGGCTIALCSETNAAEYVKKLKDHYYIQLPERLTSIYINNDFADLVFITSPGTGAEVLLPPNENHITCINGTGDIYDANILLSNV